MKLKNPSKSHSSKKPVLEPRVSNVVKGQVDKVTAIADLMSSVSKNYGDGSLMLMGESSSCEVAVIPSGSIGMDYAFGIGGYPRGRIVEIYGPEMSGKTTLTLHAIAECQRQGGVAAFIVFGLTYKHSDPIRIIFAGVAISFSLSALAAILSLYYDQSVSGMFLWGAGDVEQQGWLNVDILWKYLIVIIILVFIISKVIRLYSLGDETAQALGVPVNLIRWSMIGLGVVLTSCAVTLVGPISFIGLFIPNILRVLGFRIGKTFISLCLVLGALVLLLADTITIAIEKYAYVNFPVGVLTAMLGAPILLWALLKLNRPSINGNNKIVISGLHKAVNMNYIFIFACIIIFSAFLFSDGTLIIKSMIDGSLFQINSLNHFLYIDITLPRILLAVLAGGTLALSGFFFQGVIQNVLASPEVLGISQGATCTALLLLLFLPQSPWWSIQLAAFVGGLIAFLIVMLLSKKMNFNPLQLAMIGISLGALYAAINAGLLAISGLQSAEVLRWLTGSFYGHGWQDVYRLGLIIIFTLPLCYFFAPWITSLAFGAEKAQSLGVNIYIARFVLLFLATLQTSAVVASVGMLGFVGLMAPHLARMLGITDPRKLVIVSFLIGSVLTVFSDILSTWIFSPVEIPAGLIAPIIGTVYLLFLLHRARSN